jgi:hypothetical protein
MRRSTLIRVVLTAIALGAIPSPMGAADTAITITGVVVDSACYLSMGKKAMDPDHLKCAIVCAQKSQRLALVTQSGDVYMIVGDYAANANAKLIPLLNTVVAVTGTVAVRAPDLAVPTLATDTRRQVGTQDITFAKTIKKGDNKEGDLQNASEMTITITSIGPAPSLIP